MKLLIGADLVPTESNVRHFKNADAKELVSEDLLKILQAADYRIFNLETPLTDECTPINKCGSNFSASLESVAGIKKIGVDFFTLANNHIMDQGEQGLVSTMQILEKNGIAYAGVGMSVTEAYRPHVFECAGKKIGVYCCAEHEFSIVSATSAGANPYDPLVTFDHIEQLRKTVDCVIVLFHGGKEYYRYPSPELQRIGRKCVEKGADIVLFQHSHCIGCEEKWQKGTIVYGQGNFLFDDKENEFIRTSLLVQVTLDDHVTVSYIPIQKDGASVKLATDQRETILKEFYSRSERIKDDGFVRKEYADFAKSMLGRYLAFLHGGASRNIVWKVLNRLTAGRFGAIAMKHAFRRKDMTIIYDCILCEAHRELLIQGLQNRITD